MKVLVIEDNHIIRENICAAFRESAFAVDCTDTAEEGLWFAKQGTYDAIILDWMLPDHEGTYVTEQLRLCRIDTPIIMLTAKDRVEDRIEGLNYGADDYMAKPFDLRELIARVHALTRRQYKNFSNQIAIDNLTIDREKREVIRDGTTINLSAREYALLEYLALREGHIVSRTDIHDHVYAFEDDSTSNVVDVYIGYLRKKIEQKHLKKLIHTHRGQGYRIGIGNG